MKDNKLIAEFMGLSGRCNGKYDKSWDWLMPVHRKCMFTSNFSGDDQLRTLLIDAVIDADIDRLYDAVVEFIKEYNENERLNNEYVSYNEAPYGNNDERE